MMRQGDFFSKILAGEIVLFIPKRHCFYPKREQETGRKREKGIKNGNVQRDFNGTDIGLSARYAKVRVPGSKRVLKG